MTHDELQTKLRQQHRDHIETPTLEELTGHLAAEATDLLGITTEQLASFERDTLPVINSLIAESLAAGNGGKIDPKSLAYIRHAIETSKAIVEIEAHASRRDMVSGALKLASALLLAALGRVGGTVALSPRSHGVHGAEANPTTT